MTTNGGLYSGKVGLSRLCTVTTAIFLLFFTFCFGSWWAVGRSAGAEGVATSLLSNNEVRSGVAEKLIDQFASDADSEVKAVISEKREQLVQVVSDALANPEISAETKRIIDEVYSYYTGESTKATIDINALIKPILKSMSAIDPAFNVNDIDVKGIEPITLDDSGSAPNLAPVKSGLAVAVFVLFALLVLSIVGLAKYSRTKNSFVAVIGWEFAVIGAILIIVFFGATTGVKSAAESATDPLVNSAAPIVAETFLSMFKLQGILLLIVGVIGIITWIRTKKAQQKQ